MNGKLFKIVEVDFGCDCGECTDTVSFFVIDADMKPEAIADDFKDPRVLCECTTREKAEFVVSAINRLATN